MDDAGVVGLVDAYEYSVPAGVAVATRDPRLIHERTSLGETALHLLILGPSLEAVLSILKLGAAMDSLCDIGESPLSLAASLGKLATVQALLEVGAPVRVAGQLEPTLHKGVRSGNVELVRLLLGAGASIDEQEDFGEAPLHIAAERGDAEMIKLLLERGADAQIKSTYDGTALDIAKTEGHDACVVLLAARH